MYRKYPAMYALDDSYEGFTWVNADDASRSIFSFIRRDKTGKHSLLFVINMTPMEYQDYMVGAPVKGRYTLIFDENGKVDVNSEKKSIYSAVKGECDKQPYRISYPLPPYGCAVFRFNQKFDK
jgi:1,4-alpha-glucan branching enzyme